MASKMLEAFTPDQVHDIMEYVQIAMGEVKHPHPNNQKTMLSLRGKLGMSHSEIIAAASVLTTPKV